MRIYELMLDEQKRLLREVSNLQTELAELPEGKLLCAKNENRSKWYVSDGKNKTYISKKERGYAEKLAERRYIECKIEDCNRKLYAVTMFIRHYKPELDKSDAILRNPYFRELLDSKFSNWKQELFEWKNLSYEKMKEYPENLIHIAKNGEKVRSKSEAMIVSELFLNKIPYHYEEKLDLGDGIVYYPDFTIKHPRTGKIIYWEHFGMMDDPDYRFSAMRKLKTYEECGIHLNIDLIVTTETMDAPLGPGMVSKVIEMYLG